MLLNLASVAAAEDKSGLWGFIRRYAPEASPETHPDLDAAAADAAEARARADREAREAELAAQFAAEQEASEQARVMGLIQAKVNRNWLRPPGTGEQGLKCTVRVRLGASGSVLLVSVVESSGSNAFDRSVETAVYKADPLPMPQSPRLLADFRSGKGGN